MDYLVGASFGVGIVVLGASVGIAVIGYATMLNVARQPSKSAEMRILMIILVSLVEGLALFGIVVCLLIALGVKG